MIKALAAGVLGLATAVAWAADPQARAAVESYVTGMATAGVRDLLIDQSVTAYHPDGRHPQATVEQRVWIKLPGRQRVEQTVEGRRLVQIAIGDRWWVRGPEGRVAETSPRPRRSPVDLLIPHRRSADEALAAWRALGIRDDVVSTTRVAGRPVTVIGARPGDRDSAAAWIDREYGVVRFVTRERLPAGPALIDLTLSEHRRLAGRVFFPFRQETFVDGRLVLLVIVRSVAVDTDPADVLFEPAALGRDR